MMAGQAEFDEHAADYRKHHARNIAVSGEEPEFFSEYKVADALTVVRERGIRCDTILDFGAGIGGSIPFFRTYFPSGVLTCADPSARSLDMAAARFSGPERMVAIDEDAGLALPDNSFDLCFSACVFHHIAHARHAFWLRELRRVTRPGGLLIIFEHNPLNPLTVRAVNTCPFDVNAHLIGARALARSVADAGWARPRVRYRLFFPRLLAKLRPAERFITWCPLGAQYYVYARRPA